MAIKTAKSVFAPHAAADGWRCLVTRYWPRGVSKAHVDLYLPDLAPSAELLAAYRRDSLSWPRFAQRYGAEMGRQTSLLRVLAHASRRGQTVTLLCTCPAGQPCHRHLLAAAIREVS